MQRQERTQHGPGVCEAFPGAAWNCGGSLRGVIRVMRVMRAMRAMRVIRVMRVMRVMRAMRVIRVVRVMWSCGFVVWNLGVRRISNAESKRTEEDQ